ncbi:16127_t:CDS:10 [Dentiscutata erythropus]|uniref:16127_t:CDS:1 n=1 Tax=Dentiscutata erythropus TaxID=1348616 RepID=A0A9N8ZBD0_9GLOM|nr:16127_t:CDS:10 [Dentiscutata erythropus]
MDFENETPILTINQEYAKKYEERKRSEELSKLKEKYGDLNSDEDEGSSSSEEEDEYGELVTPEIDSQIMKTISAIKNKDPKVYDKNSNFFADEEIRKARQNWFDKQKQKKSEKPLFLKDYQRQILLESSDITEDDIKPEIDIMPEIDLTPMEEEQKLKEEFKEAASNFDFNNEEGDDDFLVHRSKTAEELKAEEEEYQAFLLESMAGNSKDSEFIKQWQDYKNDTDVNKDEAFLMDYILNRGWIDKNAKRIPTYEDLILEHHDEENDEFEEAVDNFESKYNFRFEEEGGTKVATYSRNVVDSVRRSDNKRKIQRQVRSERKNEEKNRKMEELKRLKNLKKKEIFDKLQKIKEITGNETVGFDEVDLEEDFDPEKYDKKVQNIFDSNYYAQEADADKPEWEEDIEDIVKNEQKKKAKQNFDKYLDEYYQLDYEDIIGDTPTRFKYKQVKPTSFGLTSAEFLLADDKDLNEYVSLKKIAPFRPENLVEKDIKKYSKKKRLQKFRKKLELLEEDNPPISKSWSIKSIKRKNMQQNQGQSNKKQKNKTSST